MNKIYFSIRQFLIIIFFLLFFVGIYKFPGNSFYYFVFSLVFLTLIYFALKPKSFGYLFLAIFLFLGFWLKLVVHLLLDYPYLEPIGSFDDSASSWNKVLLVSSAGGLAVLLAYFIFLKIYNTPCVKKSSFNFLHFFNKNRVLLWSILIILSLIFPFLNIELGISQLGMVPKITLPWPFKGLFGWILVFGLPVTIFAISHLDILANQKWKLGCAVVLISSFLISICFLSRATFIFSTIPYFLALGYYNCKKYIDIKFKVWVFLFFQWLVLCFLSLAIVMLLRYGQVNEGFSRHVVVNNVSPVVLGISRLAVDRWIGLEGVMAVEAYEYKNFDLLRKIASERRVEERQDFFTRNIAEIKFTEEELKKIRYASIPGGIAFFYYSNSVTLVFFGIFIFSLLLFFSEKIIILKSGNYFIGFFWAMSFAQVIVSFGQGVSQQAIFHLTSVMWVTLIIIIQRFLNKEQ